MALGPVWPANSRSIAKLILGRKSLSKISAEASLKLGTALAGSACR